MPKLLFTDEQKTALAKEAGITGVPDTNTFNKEYDPATGEQKLYMKLGTSGKFFGAKPTTTKLEGQDALNAQVDYVKQQYGGKTMQDVYGAMISTAPSTKVDIRNKIAAGPGGIGSQLEGITQQIANLQKLKAGNQQEIFNAVDPKTGQPIDPRVAVAAFQNRQKALTEQENNLRSLEDMYNAQLGALTDSEYSRQAAENEKNKTALSYLKDIEDRKTAADKIATDKSQFDAKLAEEKRQYNITNGISDPASNIPVAVNDLSSYLQKSRGTVDNLQCGEVSNDYWKMKTGTSLGMGNSFADKVSAIEKVGKSTAPVEGGVFAFPAKSFAGDTGHTGVVKQVNSDGSIEVVEANREGSSKGGKMVTHTYSADAVKKMTFSVAPTGTSQTATGKKPATFNAFVEKLNIPDIALDEKGIDEFFQAVLQDYPTESLANVAQAIRNRAPEGMKKAIDAYSAKLAEKGVQDKEVETITAKLDTMTEKSTTGYLRTLDTKFPDPKKVIETLHKAGFFDVYGPHWHGDDDQYDAVQAYAENKGIDLEETLKTLNGETSTK